MHLQEAFPDYLSVIRGIQLWALTALQAKTSTTAQACILLISLFVFLSDRLWTPTLMAASAI